MVRDVGTYLWDIERSGELIERFLHGRTFLEYEQDDLLRAGVERMFEIIGEALSQIGSHYPESLTELPVGREYIGLRNILIHRYVDIDDGVIWSIVQRDLPLLRSQVARLLAELSLE